MHDFFPFLIKHIIVTLWSCVLWEFLRVLTQKVGFLKLGEKQIHRHVPHIIPASKYAFKCIIQPQKVKLFPLFSNKLAAKPKKGNAKGLFSLAGIPS